MRTLLCILFVGVSLESYYFHSVGVAVFSIFSLLGLAIIVVFGARETGARLPLNRQTAVAAVFVFYLAWSFSGLLFYGDAPDVKRVLAFGVAIIGVIAGVLLTKRVPAEDLVKFYLVVHIIFFFVQFLAWYGFALELDYLYAMTGRRQTTNVSFTYPVIGRVIRPSGLYSEPGTYATFVAPMVALWSRWAGRDRANKMIFAGGLLTLFLSLSTFGVVFGLLIIIFSRQVRLRYRVATVVVGLLVAAPYLYNRFVILPGLGYEAGLGVRENFLRESFGFIFGSPIGFVFGSNLLVPHQPRVDLILAHNDMGLIFYLAHFSGPLLTAVLLLLCAWIFYGLDRPARIGFGIILLSKMSPFTAFFPVLLTVILGHSADQRSRGAPQDETASCGGSTADARQLTTALQ